MYSNILDALVNPSPNALATSTSDSKHVAVSFKAGKIDVLHNSNNRYTCIPNPTRGTVQLVWNAQQRCVDWEFVDRTSKECLETFPQAKGTFQRITLDSQPEQRIYVYKRTAIDPEEFPMTSMMKPYRMFWMQSQSEEGEDEIVAKVNQYLVSPEDAAPESPGQVDALSNILENLGMPQQQATSATATSTTTSATPPTNASTSAGGTLTLADLQGAMAGLGGATTNSNASTSLATEPVPLHRVVTPASIQSLDDAAKARLLELLPEDQRTMEHLHDNLTSPQIQQTLRALSQALMPDEQGQLDGYHSVIANFQLDPQDGQTALAAGNPIQAFLDCVLASVEKEAAEEQKDNENGNDEEEMQE